MRPAGVPTTTSLHRAQKKETRPQFSPSLLLWCASFVQGLVFDLETNSTLRAEMAKKNLFVKKGMNACHVRYKSKELFQLFLFLASREEAVEGFVLSPRKKARCQVLCVNAVRLPAFGFLQEVREKLQVSFFFLASIVLDTVTILACLISSSSLSFASLPSSHSVVQHYQCSSNPSVPSVALLHQSAAFPQA